MTLIVVLALWLDGLQNDPGPATCVLAEVCYLPLGNVAEEDTENLPKPGHKNPTTWAPHLTASGK